jgi:hypothetical protein
MRRQLPILAVTLACAAPAAALDLPARKAGLWELRMSFEGRNLPTQVSQHCIDAETDKQMSALGGNMRQDMCQKQDVTKAGDTIVVDSVCKIGPATTTSHGVISGDFNSAYTVKVSSKREGVPAIPGLPGDGTSNMTLEAKWLGPCQADQKPGDLILPGGIKMNLRDMANRIGVPGGAPGAPLAPR